MSKLSKEDLIKDLDFKCARCQVECSKVNAIEPELGYISMAPGHEGEIVKPLCNKCFEETPEELRKVNKLPETAFTVVIRQDGEGAYMVPEGTPVTYLRDATSNDVIFACQTVIRDITDALFTQKLLRLLPSGKKQSKLILPR